MSILVAIDDPNPEKWSIPLQANLPDHDVLTLHEDVSIDSVRNKNIRYLFAWRPPSEIFNNLPELEVIFSLGAGVDHLFSYANLPEVPIVRFVDPDLTTRMGEWVVLQVLYHARQHSSYQRQQAEKIWKTLDQPASTELSVGLLGMGVLGTHVAKLLNSIGFQVSGWCQTPKNLPNVTTYTGSKSLPRFLSQIDILVNILPYTPQTHGFINMDLLRQLRGNARIGGAFLINAGRGKSQVEEDIIQALEEGTLAGASLDVFESEPLPDSSRLWCHPNVVVTPHSAADSDPKYLALYVAETIRNYENGGYLDNLVDKVRGY